MDFTEQNLENIRAIHLHNMSVVELVKADAQVDSRFHFSKGVWWREVKPFFYQPAVFMMRIMPHQAKPRFWRAMGGYYHLVPEGTESNGRVVVNEISEPSKYGLQSLSTNMRSQIRRGLARCKICRVTVLDHLLKEGYRIYLSWEERTPDARVRRSDPMTFRGWMTRTFGHPYTIILGAYYEGRLISYVIFYAAEGVANLFKSFTDVTYAHLYPSVALLYAYIEIAGQNPAIHKVCHGLRSHKDSLENYKAKFGFQHVVYPAYIQLRAPLRPLTRWLMPDQYRRLMGQYSSNAEASARQEETEKDKIRDVDDQDLARESNAFQEFTDLSPW